MNKDRMYYLHRWCGLFSGLLLVLFSSTGIGLLFYDQWQQRADSAWNEVSNPSGTYSWDASFRKVLESYPGWSVSGYPPAGPDRTLVYALERGGDHRRLYVHPVTGLILYEAAEDRRFHRVLRTLHGSLLAGRAGRILVLLTGLLLLVSLVTGFRLFRHPVNFQKVTSVSGRLHARIGIGSLVFQLLVVISGMVLAAAHLRTKAPAYTSAIPGYVPVTFGSVDAAQEQVRRQFPGFRAEVLWLAPDHLIFAGRFKEDASLFGPSPSQIILRKPGQRAEVLTAASAGRAEKTVRVSRVLHGGRFGGWPVQLLYALLGIVSLLLSVTGLLARRQRKVRAKGQRQSGSL
ncbi:MAG TPA: PepSY-associated TM helix domain-containing protein [Chitinophagaceae bacterium]|nr:PepSY-associated TM helix domain-containing protein [Chitinophagaceae bacterium]